MRLVLNELRKSLKILLELGASPAAGLITYKLIDIIDDIDGDNKERAIEDLWHCAVLVQKLLYESLSTYIGAEHNLQIDATNPRDAYYQYLQACTEVTQGTGYKVLFIRDNHGEG